ncbi:undecaprenyl-diphosphatase [Caldicoprobacter guelmensis]|uniref:undecaprenyl-diphosphate phosphatase n=1 Tax=Caldicoprobacter guelmensis TaxID=1170224 RepID=UPI00195C67F9|nr:undecaprenyl-diphosphate phosphatase [Caldicoprobacter guelmensis]MBM7581465.1 undecaprenyl-diphosphatase [Caldicoprobacter guelmensis]
MSLLYAIFLGILQGLTEFLPISSSGHLVIAQEVFKIEGASLAFDVILHVGTLVAVLIYYWRDVLSLISEFFVLIGDYIRGKNPKLLDHSRPYRVLMVMIIIATIPTALIGIIFNDLFSRLFETADFVGFELIVTGILLWIANGIVGGRKDLKNMTPLDAVTVGLMQGLAITPGISRSGATIFGGLIRGLSRELATRFSFLLSIPAILGAVVLEGKDAFESASAIHEVMPVLAGFLAAAVSGYLAIHLLISALQKKKLNYFSYYCWGLGILTIIYTWFVA